jgi:hypothetical protein
MDSATIKKYLYYAVPGVMDSDGSPSEGIFDGPMPTVLGTGYWRNGGYANSLTDLRGASASLSLFNADTQMALLDNAADVPSSSILQDGFNRMHSPPMGSFSIKSRASQASDWNLCLDIDHASTSLGADVLSYSCHGGANQKFVKRPIVGDHEAFNQQVIFEVSYDGQCLNVAHAGGDGAPLIQYPCALDGQGGLNEMFAVEPAATAGYYTIKPKHSNGDGMCVAVPNSSSGGQVTLRACTSGSALQEFTLE